MQCRPTSHENTLFAPLFSFHFISLFCLYVVRLLNEAVSAAKVIFRLMIQRFENGRPTVEMTEEAAVMHKFKLQSGHLPRDKTAEKMVKTVGEAG